MAFETDIVESKKGEKFLILKECNDTLATMVMLKQVPIYWVDFGGNVSLVENPQTIYGGSPNRFGIKID